MKEHAAILIRKLNSMFPDAGLREGICRELQRYGNEQHERETARVRVAILKVAGASREQIREWVDVAKRDYRDVLAAAEYPHQLRFKTWMMADSERNAIATDDLRQYETWIME